MSFNAITFGPSFRAEVTIIGGVATKVEIFHPTKTNSSIIMPADWACNVTDPVQTIINDVSASLNGAIVKKVP